MSRQRDRRQFLQASGLAGVGFWAAGGVALAADQPKVARAASEKLNVAFVGVGGMGGGNLDSIAGLGENVVALCDIDDVRLNAAANKHRKAKKYNDFRKMLDEQKDIDAVVVSTPDHCHAVAAMRALKMGKHVYCEKPLTYSIYEARQMRLTAAEKKVATCMGNRGTATNGFRAGVELLHSGVIGPVREVHVWTDRPSRYWKQGMDRPKDTPKVPSTVHWNLWLGPAPERPYNPIYHPFAWRGWQDFGTGALGDMACHTCNLAYMGLKLGFPNSAVAVSSPMNKETYPLWSTINFTFPERSKEFPAVKLTWYDGIKDGKQNLPPEEVLKGLKLPGQGKLFSGSLLIGDKGILYSPNDYGERYDILTKDREKLSFNKPEATLPRVPSQYADWVNACKGGRPALANFNYAGMLTETILLGNVALRAGKKIEWNGEEMKSTNGVNVAALVQREYRKGWSL